MKNCPHCHLRFDDPIATVAFGAHMCRDRDPWTQQEKDAQRARGRQLGIRFGPSSEQIAARFGARNRADRLAEKGI